MHCLEKKCFDCSGTNEKIIDKDVVHQQQIKINVSQVKIISKWWKIKLFA